MTDPGQQHARVKHLLRDDATTGRLFGTCSSSTWGRLLLSPPFVVEFWFLITALSTIKFLVHDATRGSFERDCTAFACETAAVAMDCDQPNE